MKVIIYGASGMVGRGVLLECLDATNIESILTVNRSDLKIDHPKLQQLIINDFTDYQEHKMALSGYDACYFCLGVSAVGMTEEDYTRITYDFALAAAKTLYELNPEMTFTYVSGQGTDSSEPGRSMWARVKGKTENDIMKLGFKKAIMFRPGGIKPLRGIKSRTKMYQFILDYFGWLFALIQLFSPNSLTDTTRIGLAMINAPKHGKDQSILTPKDINDLAAK